jgi:hypothetical protein
MTDFRALCVELTDCLEKADWPHRYKVVFQQWTDIARAALAEPQPAADGDVAATGKPGLQVEPIPVSERLPEAGDCDAEGRCWFNAYDHNWLLEDKMYGSNAARSHWLPFNALPLPKEVE